MTGTVASLPNACPGFMTPLAKYKCFGFTEAYFACLGDGNGFVAANIGSTSSQA
jgi:hypothetical protein